MKTAGSKKAPVLVIEAETDTLRMLKGGLEKSGFSVIEALTGEEGINQAARCEPGAVLLDVDLPDMDGLAVLKHLREGSRVPIMILSKRCDEAAIVGALDNGANDFIAIPFSLGELMARVRVTQRYYKPPAVKTDIFQAGNLSVDLSSRTVKVKDRKVRLTATEYSLLRLFIQHAGKVLTHRQILRKIWGLHEIDKIAYLRVYLAYLREKLEVDPAQPKLLITEPGVGYRLAFPD